MSRRLIVGIDEVGRGAWAGPLVVAAAVIDPAVNIGLNDSKVLSKKRRNALVPVIKQKAAWIGLGWVSARHIDTIGMSAALKLAAKRSVAGLPPHYDEIIIDGTIKLLEGEHVSTLPKADGLIASVMAASVVAKVARDTYMEKLAASFPEYGFERHVGYGTAFHHQQLNVHGGSAVHRMTFAPMKSLKGGISNPAWRTGNHAIGGTLGGSSYATGGVVGEDAASQWLQARGYTILDRNWKTKLCEIDIIALKDATVYFVEVKYRRTALAGRGLDYVTAQKQHQMAFAARSWVHAKGWQGQIRLAAAEVAGKGEVTAFVSDIAVG